MNLFERLLTEVMDGEVDDVRVGAFWTAVAVKTGAGRRCGLAASLRPEVHIHGSDPDVPAAGNLIGGDARAQAAYVDSPRVMERAIGLATLNALLPRKPTLWTDGNAETMLAQRGTDKRVAMVGHFPFAERLRSRVGELWVLELHPRGDDLPAETAPDVIPQADIVAITGTTLLNGTFGELSSLCRDDAYVMVLGPSTPLSEIMFDYGVDMVSGAVVEPEPDGIDAVLAAVSEGAAFRQVHRTGVRLVNMERPGDA